MILFIQSQQNSILRTQMICNLVIVYSLFVCFCKKFEQKNSFYLKVIKKFVKFAVLFFPLETNTLSDCT